VPSVAIRWENKAEFSPDRKQVTTNPFTIYFEVWLQLYFKSQTTAKAIRVTGRGGV
jgi:hypothetical protein